MKPSLINPGIPTKIASEGEKPSPSYSYASSVAQDDESDQEKSNGIALPSYVAGSDSLDRLVGTARDYDKA